LKSEKSGRKEPRRRGVGRLEKSSSFQKKTPKGQKEKEERDGELEGRAAISKKN